MQGPLAPSIYVTCVPPPHPSSKFHPHSNFFPSITDFQSYYEELYRQFLTKTQVFAFIHVECQQCILFYLNIVRTVILIYSVKK